MNKKIKKLWVKALRSGKYKQGKGQLRTKNSFCCLGVLCDLHNKKNKENNWKKDEDGYSDFSYLGSEASLPEIVQEWAELKDDNPDITISQKVNTTLAQINDGVLGIIKSKNFKQIANIIEKQL